MTERGFSDETLMAYADGELESDLRSKLEKALVEDPNLLKRVEQFRRSRSQARQAFDELFPNEPNVARDEALLSLIETEVGKSHLSETQAEPRAQSAAVFSIPRAGRGDDQDRRSLLASRWKLPLAASISLLAGGLGGYFLASSGDHVASQFQIAELRQDGLAEAISSVPSGQETILSRSGDRFRAIATFRDQADVLCREFEVDHGTISTVVAVACSMDGAWQTQFTVLSGVADTGYAPASSLEALDAYLSAAGAGAPLSLEEEARALARFSN